MQWDFMGRDESIDEFHYINNTLNKDEGDEVDVIIFSKNIYKTKDQVEIEIIGMMTREDNDHKVIAYDKSENESVFKDLDERERKLILDYFGYKSPIISIDDKEKTIEYINQSQI